jgi:hypothetical protein
MASAQKTILKGRIGVLIFRVKGCLFRFNSYPTFVDKYFLQQCGILSNRSQIVTIEMKRVVFDPEKIGIGYS